MYVHQAISPVLVALRSDRPLMPDRRRVTIRRQSGGGAFATSPVIRDQVVIVTPGTQVLPGTGSGLYLGGSAEGGTLARAGRYTGTPFPGQGSGAGAQRESLVRGRIRWSHGVEPRSGNRDLQNCQRWLLEQGGGGAGRRGGGAVLRYSVNVSNLDDFADPPVVTATVRLAEESSGDGLFNWNHLRVYNQDLVADFAASILLAIGGASHEPETARHADHPCTASPPPPAGAGGRGFGPAVLRPDDPRRRPAVSRGQVPRPGT